LLREEKSQKSQPFFLSLFSFLLGWRGKTEFCVFLKSFFFLIFFLCTIFFCLRDFFFFFFGRVRGFFAFVFCFGATCI
jgi:hypothetical protein